MINLIDQREMKHIIEKSLPPEENKKINEIFKELDDEEEEPTIH